MPNFLSDAGLDVIPTGQEFDDRAWVYVGRLAEEKGILELVNHWNPSIPLRIYGDGPLREEVERASRGKSIKIMGLIPSAQVASAVARSVGLVFPSLWEEPAPAVSYLHALSAGKATLTTRNNAVGDDVSANSTGIVAQDVEQLAQIAATAPELSPAEANAARVFATRYTEQAWISRISAVYTSVRN